MSTIVAGSSAPIGAQMLPIGFGIPLGTLIAWIGAKRTMLVSDAARPPLMLVLPILHWTGHLSFGVLLAAAFAVGCFAAPYFGSSRLVVPEVAREDEHAVGALTFASALLRGGAASGRVAMPDVAHG